MNDPIFSPCPVWAEKLAVFQSKELSSADREALDAHIASCLACKAVLDKYLELDERLHDALLARRPLQVSTELLQLENRDLVEEEEDVAKGIKGDLIYRRKIIFRSVPKRSITYRISFAGGMFNAIAAILVMSLIIGGYCSLYYMKHTILSTLTSSAVPTPSTPTSGVPEYSVLATSYAGTVLDLLTNEKTSMFLRQIQQKQGSISGNFQGFGLAVPFKGSVTKEGHIQFNVKFLSSTTLSFEGDTKVGGDMTGSFAVLDQHGQRTGESGMWNVASNSS